MSQQQISSGRAYGGAQQTGQKQDGRMQQPTGQQGGRMQQPQIRQGGQMQQQMGLQSQLFGTTNYLPQNVREETINLLNLTLADATVLRTQTKYAHWNVKGSDFYGLHELFEDIAEMFEDHIDEIAERATALGGQALGTVEQADRLRRIPTIPPTIVLGMDFVEVIADHIAIYDANLHEAIEIAKQFGDEDTVDLLNEVSREVSRKLWFLEAHLQTQPVSSVSVQGGGIQQGQTGGAGGGQQPQQFQHPGQAGQQFQPQQDQEPLTQQYR